jgi:hypothetical protein
MLSIYKYPVPIDDYFTLELPFGARPLSVQVQNGGPQLWVLIDPGERRTEERRFRLAGTGHPIEESSDFLEYISTFQLSGGALVFHVFEVQ